MSLQTRINGLEFRYLERYATAANTLSEGNRFFLDYVMSQVSALRDHRSAQIDDDVLLMQQGLMCHNLGTYDAFVKLCRLCENAQRNKRRGHTLPFEWYAYYSFALSYVGRLEEALEVALDGCEKYPDFEWCYDEAAALLAHFGRRKEALALTKTLFYDEIAEEMREGVCLEKLRPAISRQKDYWYLKTLVNKEVGPMTRGEVPRPLWTTLAKSPEALAAAKAALGCEDLAADKTEPLYLSGTWGIQMPRKRAPFVVKVTLESNEAGLSHCSPEALRFFRETVEKFLATNHGVGAQKASVRLTLCGEVSLSVSYARYEATDGWETPLSEKAWRTFSQRRATRATRLAAKGKTLPDYPERKGRWQWRHDLEKAIDYRDRGDWRKLLHVLPTRLDLIDSDIAARWEVLKVEAIMGLAEMTRSPDEAHLFYRRALETLEQEARFFNPLPHMTPLRIALLQKLDRHEEALQVLRRWNHECSYEGYRRTVKGALASFNALPSEESLLARARRFWAAVEAAYREGELYIERPSHWVRLNTAVSRLLAAVHPELDIVSEREEKRLLILMPAYAGMAEVRDVLEATYPASLRGEFSLLFDRPETLDAWLNSLRTAPEPQAVKTRETLSRQQWQDWQSEPVQNSLFDEWPEFRRDQSSLASYPLYDAVKGEWDGDLALLAAYFERPDYAPRKTIPEPSAFTVLTQSGASVGALVLRLPTLNAMPLEEREPAVQVWYEQLCTHLAQTVPGAYRVAGWAMGKLQTLTVFLYLWDAEAVLTAVQAWAAKEEAIETVLYRALTYYSTCRYLKGEEDWDGFFLSVDARLRPCWASEKYRQFE